MRLEGAEEGLVFGRIDLADGTVLRIGRLGLHRDADELPVLLDWRAEAARPFYEATPVHPMGLRRLPPPAPEAPHGAGGQR